jgi:hypothetical protein
MGHALYGTMTADAMLDLGRTSGGVLVMKVRGIGVLGRRVSRAPHRAMRRGCRDDTNEISAGYVRRKSAVNVSHSTTSQPFNPAITQLPNTALRGGAVNAQSRVPVVVAVGAQHRGIDGAEHSAILSDVMADYRHDPSPDRAVVCAAYAGHVTDRDRSQIHEVYAGMYATPSGTIQRPFTRARPSAGTKA